MATHEILVLAALAVAIPLGTQSSSSAEPHPTDVEKSHLEEITSATHDYVVRHRGTVDDRRQGRRGEPRMNGGTAAPRYPSSNVVTPKTWSSGKVGNSPVYIRAVPKVCFIL